MPKRRNTPQIPVGDLLRTIRDRAGTLSQAQQQVAATVLEDPQFALRANVDALARRARVSQARRLRVAVPALARAWWARRGGRSRGTSREPWT